MKCYYVVDIIQSTFDTVHFTKTLEKEEKAFTKN